MKPLNYKERDDKFFYFVVAGTITLVMTIFCFYYSNDVLTDAISVKRVEQYSRFQQYKRNQQQYIKQLEQVNSALASPNNAFVSDKIDDFRKNFTRKGDTSVLMNKIVDLSYRGSDIIEEKNKLRGEVNERINDLRKCQKELAK